MTTIQLSPQLQRAVKMMKKSEQVLERDIVSSLSQAEAESVSKTFKRSAANRTDSTVILSTWG